MMRGLRRPAAAAAFAAAFAAAWLGTCALGYGAGFSTAAPSVVQAGSFYTGAVVRVHGIVHPHSAVAIRMAGEVEHHPFNHRQKIWFIWGGVGHVTFKNAPTSYLLTTSGALASIADRPTRESLLLGLDPLTRSIVVEPPLADAGVLTRDFIKLKEREGLYGVDLGGVEMSDVEENRRGFTAELFLPPRMSPGRYEVEVLEFSGGHLVNKDLHEIRFERVGMPGYLGALARDRRTLFGLLSLAAMLLLGLVIGAAGQFKKGEVSPHRIMGKATALRVLRGMRTRLGQPGEEEIARMRAKYEEFQTLLSLNNEVLELLVELEEESSWASFRHARVRMAIRALLDGSMDMVRTLNRLADNAYFDLEAVVSGIRGDVSAFLDKLPETEKAPLTIPLSEVRGADEQRIGGKALNLARAQCDLGMRVPDSFVVTTEAYRQFMETGGLADRIRAILAPARIDDLDDLAARSRQVRSCVEETPIPPSVERALTEAARSLGLGPGEGLAVRSTAVGEDSGLSFAGQFESVLNVPGADLPRAWKTVISSRYLDRAIFYRRAAGVAEVDTPMAVLVQRMLAPRASGVLYTRRPDRPKEPVMLISSAWGIGRDVSGGSARADEWVLSRRRPFKVLQREVVRKDVRLAADPAGGVHAVELSGEDQDRPSLSESELTALAETALRIDGYFGTAQDLEWALDADGRVAVLQSRPLRTETVKVSGKPPPADATVLLEGGRPVWAGRAVGPLWRAESPDRLDRVPEGSILVLTHPMADAVRVFPRVCGVVVEHGSVTGHMASVLREFRVPSLFGLPGATALEPGRPASLESSERKLFAGYLWPELRGQLPLSLHGRRTTGLPENLAERLTTLSGGMLMATWTCRSIHDVVRFCHEMGIQAMFGIGDELADAKLGGVKKLESPGLPASFHLIDLGGGLAEGLESVEAVRPEQVVSVPFGSLWTGYSDVRFKSGPLQDGDSGSLASMMTTTGFGGTGGRALGTPSYACLTRSHLNLNSRQAYHFAIVDAHVCPNQNSNHISFRLKGGGAAEWQRLLRVRFAAEILRIHHFSVSERGDLLNGWLRGLDIPTSAEKLAMIGRLLRFCGQLDMWMTRPDSVRRYVEAFREAEERVRDGGASGSGPGR